MACAGLLYGQARGLLADPRAKDLVRRIVDALGMNGGQRFITQAGETAGLLLRQLDRMGPDTEASLGLSAAGLQADMHSILIGVFNTRVDSCVLSFSILSSHAALLVHAEDISRAQGPELLHLYCLLLCQKSRAKLINRAVKQIACPREVTAILSALQGAVCSGADERVSPKDCGHAAEPACGRLQQVGAPADFKWV